MALFAAALASAAVWTLTSVNSLPLPSARAEETLGGLSGLTALGDDVYFAVSDQGDARRVHRLSIGVDRTTGGVTNVVLLGSGTFAKGKDVEGVVWDAAQQWLWTADEADNSIRAFKPTGELMAEVDVPPVFKKHRCNFGFESLAISRDGLTLWTCNEDALACDGPRAARGTGAPVRLQRFTRPSSTAPWRADGQWAYPTDGLGGRDIGGKSRNGVAELLCLDDGTLLALEREMSIKKKALLPSFRCRIYALDLTGATDVSSFPSLGAGGFQPVAKRRVYGANTGIAMYEGLSLGPTLADGSRSVLMVSDGGEGAAGRVMALRFDLTDRK